MTVLQEMKAQASAADELPTRGTVEGQDGRKSAEVNVQSFESGRDSDAHAGRGVPGIPAKIQLTGREQDNVHKCEDGSGLDAALRSDAVSQSFADLIAGGRQLFRRLPFHERADLFRSLSHGKSVLSEIVRDACAVTLQCAVRGRRARQRWRAEHPNGHDRVFVANRQSSLSSSCLSSEESFDSLVADGGDLIVRLPSSERVLLLATAKDGSIISNMISTSAAISLQCAIRARLAVAEHIRRSIAEREQAEDEVQLNEDAAYVSLGQVAEEAKVKERASQEVQVLHAEHSNTSDDWSIPVTPPIYGDDDSDDSRPPTPPVPAETLGSSEKGNWRASSARRQTSGKSVQVSRVTSNNSCSLLVPVNVSDGDASLDDCPDGVPGKTRSREGTHAVIDGEKSASSDSSLGPFLEVANATVREAVGSAGQSIEQPAPQKEDMIEPQRGDDLVAQSADEEQSLIASGAEVADTAALHGSGTMTDALTSQQLATERAARESRQPDELHQTGTIFGATGASAGDDRQQKLTAMEDTSADAVALDEGEVVMQQEQTFVDPEASGGVEKGVGSDTARVLEEENTKSNDLEGRGARDEFDGFDEERQVGGGVDVRGRKEGEEADLKDAEMEKVVGCSSQIDADEYGDDFEEANDGEWPGAKIAGEKHQVEVAVEPDESADYHNDDDFEDLNEGVVKQTEMGHDGRDFDAAIKVKPVHPDYQDEGYDDFEASAITDVVDGAHPPEDDGGQNEKEEYSSHDDSDTELESRGTTAYSVATTLPRTGKGTRPVTQFSSRIATSTSEAMIFNTNDNNCTSTRASTAAWFRRSYIDSVDGQMISHPESRAIQWELPYDEQGLEDWPNVSSVFPTSGVSNFPSLDPVIRPHTTHEDLRADDDADNKQSFKRMSSEERRRMPPKDKLHPRYRARINLFLGITVWPPPYVAPEAPPPPPVSLFVEIWYRILDGDLHTKFVSWTMQGTAFCIRDPLGFQEFVLPSYFSPTVKTRSGANAARPFVARSLCFFQVVSPIFC